MKVVLLILIVLLSCSSCEEPGPQEYILTTAAVFENAGSVSPTAGVFIEDTSVTLEAFPNDGWEFDFWIDVMGQIVFEDSVFYTENPVEILMNADKAIGAVFTINSEITIDDWSQSYKDFSESWADVRIECSLRNDGVVSIGYFEIVFEVSCTGGIKYTSTASGPSGDDFILPGKTYPFSDYLDAEGREALSVSVVDSGIYEDLFFFPTPYPSPWEF